MTSFAFTYTIPGPPAISLNIEFDYAAGDPGRTDRKSVV
jgi:hypothetical protein